jgi:Mn2+/Fe2+ NRAMP family transporter
VKAIRQETMNIDYGEGAYALGPGALAATAQSDAAACARSPDFTARFSK